MEGLQKMLESIDYIESNLQSKLEMDDIASIAYMSKFHFQRMFHMITGVTVADYIRKRRLTLAAQELTHANRKVIDVALQYGYETPESFSKAFRKAHGISPSEVREHSKQLKAYPRLSFQIQIKGDQEMNYKIIERDYFEIIGKGIKVQMENKQVIAEYWNESNQNGFSSTLAQNCGPLGLLGVCMDFNPTQEEFTYFIGAEKMDGNAVDGDFEKKVIPAATWAIFESVGPMPTAIQKVWDRIFSEWFPSTGYEHAIGPEMEVYPEGDPSDENYRCEVWIPIVKK